MPTKLRASTQTGNTAIRAHLWRQPPRSGDHSLDNRHNNGILRRQWTTRSNAVYRCTSSAATHFGTLGNGRLASRDRFLYDVLIHPWTIERKSLVKHCRHSSSPEKVHIQWTLFIRNNSLAMVSIDRRCQGTIRYVRQWTQYTFAVTMG